MDCVFLNVAIILFLVFWYYVSKAFERLRNNMCIGILWSSLPVIILMSVNPSDAPSIELPACCDLKILFFTHLSCLRIYVM